MENQKKNSILIVDDDAPNIMALTQILSPLYNVSAVKDGQDAVEFAEEFLPDVILMDIVMPEIDGYEAIKRLKSIEKTREIPVIFITGLNSAGDEEKGLSLGAADYINKPFGSEIVKLRVGNQIKMLNQLRTIEQLSLSDQLTSIPNRRCFDNRIVMEWMRAVRERSFISFLIMDVDKFKNYNDTYGHNEGDNCLKTIANTLSKSITRDTDFVARFGGEEFVVVLPHADRDGACMIAEKFLKNIRNCNIPHGTSDVAPYVTISIGVTTGIVNHTQTGDDYIKKSDEMLYASKRAGRDRYLFTHI
jgi:diguanylate cyclase (GGDEF)-like protein